jgi:hypothetical protein
MATPPSTKAPTYQEFFDAVLTKLGITPTKGAREALASVVHYEGINNYYNPLNSVVPYGKSTPFNSVGVQEYQSFSDGVNGTVKLLEGSPWVNVVQALKGGNENSILNSFDTVYHSWGSPGPSAYSGAPLILGYQLGSQKYVGNAGQGTAIGHAVGGLADPTIGAVSAGADIVNGVTDTFDLFKNLVGTVTSAKFWIRVGFVLLGFMFIVIAVDRMTSGGIVAAVNGTDSPTQPAETIVEETGEGAEETDEGVQSATEPVGDAVTKAARPKGSPRKKSGPLTDGAKRAVKDTAKVASA